MTGEGRGTSPLSGADAAHINAALNLPEPPPAYLCNCGDVFPSHLARAAHAGGCPAMNEGRVATGDRVTMRLGESVVHGVVHEVKHGGASVTVKVDGFEQHAMWFAMPPWTVTPPARTATPDAPT